MAYSHSPIDIQDFKISRFQDLKISRFILIHLHSGFQDFKISRFQDLFSFTYRHSGLALRIRLRLGIELTVNQLEGGLTPKRNPSKSLAIRVRVRVRVTW